MSKYVGRFAPSPTGRLHLGSLVCAVASYLDARAHNGRWLVRVENIDPPREEPGAADAILASLENHGLHWDGEVLWQHTRLSEYAAITEALLTRGRAFRCDCPRKGLAAIGTRYSGRCRHRDLSANQPHAVRLRVQDNSNVAFEDAFQGEYHQRVGEDFGDFIIRRRDGLPAYQLAVAVDDIFQEITTVIRGADLLDSTPRQILVMRELGLTTPTYGHHAVLVNAEGQKLSKQTHAPALDETTPTGNLNMALKFLGQPTYPGAGQDVDELLRKATSSWRRDRVPRGFSRYQPTA